MFRRNSPVSGLQRPESAENTSQTAHAELPLNQPARPAAVAAASAPQSLSARPVGMPSQMAPASAQPAAKAGELPVSRFGGIPGVMPRRVGAQGEATSQGQSEPTSGLRELIVGMKISLSGDITECDVLKVHGYMDANMPDGKYIEISQDGHFKGTAEVDEADIAGTFEGTLTVRGRVKLRATGKIIGTLSYGEIEVEAGGQLMGEVKVLQSASSKSKSAETTSKSVELLAGVDA